MNPSQTEIRKDHLKNRKPDLVLFKKNKNKNKNPPRNLLHLAVPKTKRKDKLLLQPCQRTEKNKQPPPPKNRKKQKQKLWNIKVTVIPVRVSALGAVQKVWKKTGRTERKRNNHDHSDCIIAKILCKVCGSKERKTMRGRVETNYSIIKIGQNTKKSPGDLRNPAVTQTPV